MMHAKWLTTYRQIFGNMPDYMGFAPGRVNLIGEHTDYTGGLVFPVALNIGTTVLSRKRSDGKFRVYSMNFEAAGVLTFTVTPTYEEELNWANYPKGLAVTLEKHGYRIPHGLDILFVGNIPNGAGLSSSASIELAAAHLYNQVFGFELDDQTLVEYAKETENEFIGVQCGIMDQFVIGMGIKDHALLLDTHTLTYDQIPLHLKGHKLIVVNSMVRRSLSDSKYNLRIQEAQTAKSLLESKNVTYLGALQTEDLPWIETTLQSEAVYKKVRHIVTENQRTINASKALADGNLEVFGKCMLESHQSLKEDFEVSVPELDMLVERLMSLGAIGARMTGAGFGGCVVGLVPTDRATEIEAKLISSYEDVFKKTPEIYWVASSDGAFAMEIPESFYINGLLDYGLMKGFFEIEDRIYIQNLLLHSIQRDAMVSCPLSLEMDLNQSASVLLEGLLSKVKPELRDCVRAQLMGVLLPRPSEVIKTFKTRYKEGPKEATDWYYQFSIESGYIQKERTDLNLKWLYPSTYGEIQITINLSKPEKDPKQIQAELNAPKVGYPSCLLCKENEGYYGRVNHPGRTNHRIIPLTLNGSKWFFQYSPYLYYNEHAIIFSDTHTPMKITPETFSRMLTFVTDFPHYFIGSNADLPLVGGSILTHDHYQGGRHRFPMDDAKSVMGFTHMDYPGVSATVLKWPLSVIRLSGKEPKTILDAAETILKAWQGYSDESVAILAEHETEGHLEKHNTITPVARRKESAYELDLVLRNNRRDAANPTGIFHPASDVHAIKRENIGVIEVMGLAILPARLKDELVWIQTHLKGGHLTDSQLENLKKHAPMMTRLERGRQQSSQSLEKQIQDEVGRLFLKGLEDAGVFKQTEQGLEAFKRFMSTLGWQKGAYPYAD